MTIIQIFLDLDGVLADFDRGVLELTGKRPEELPPARMWSAIARHEDFFGTLALMEEAHRLWEFCAPHGPKILTGLPRGKWAAPQKHRWVAKMLGADVEVITCQSSHKYRWSGPGHLLVDDRASLQLPWEEAGGHFILHRSVEHTLEQLEAMGL
jgi:hypothetical protein